MPTMSPLRVGLVLAVFELSHSGQRLNQCFGKEGMLRVKVEEG